MKIGVYLTALVLVVSCSFNGHASDGDPCEKPDPPDCGTKYSGASIEVEDKTVYENIRCINDKDYKPNDPQTTYTVTSEYFNKIAGQDDPCDWQLTWHKPIEESFPLHPTFNGRTSSSISGEVDLTKEGSYELKYTVEVTAGGACDYPGADGEGTITVVVHACPPAFHTPIATIEGQLQGPGSGTRSLGPVNGGWIEYLNVYSITNKTYHLASFEPALYPDCGNSGQISAYSQKQVGILISQSDF